MSAMSIRLPDSLHRNARAYAAREGVSVNQLVATALAEKLAALRAAGLATGLGSGLSYLLDMGTAISSARRPLAISRLAGRRQERPDPNPTPQSG